LTKHPFVPLSTYEEYPVDEMRQRLYDFYSTVNNRRTVREFSDRPVPRDIIEDALRAAGTAPSGANLQPWHFSVVSGAATKKRIRVAAEIEEKEFYEHRAPPDDAMIPDINRKPLEDFISFVDD
jgi:iodotyrosine deiodinase